MRDDLVNLNFNTFNKQHRGLLWFAFKLNIDDI